jgi:hypothetical protein
MVPSGPRQLWLTVPVCAVTLTRRRLAGNACTLIELVYGDTAGSGTSGRRSRTCHAKPCVLSSSLECGDHCKEYTLLCVCIVSVGAGESVLASWDVLHMWMRPSGYVPPVASKSGFHGHHATAYLLFSRPGLSTLDCRVRLDELTFTGLSCFIFPTRADMFRASHRWTVPWASALTAKRSS